MLKNPVLPLMATLLLAAHGAAQSGGWIKYASPEGRYEVGLPNQPKLGSQEITTAGGDKLQQYTAIAGDQTHAFGTAYFDYPVGTTFSLDKARDGMIEHVHGTLLREDSISLGGSPGRQLKVLATIGQAEFITVARLYDIKRRIYVLQCIFPKAEEGPTATQACDKFFDSLKVSN